jgi:V-type H+-transporting ATPase S1 subunit
VGFFSIGILSGIFITILLMGIITWGIVMIMNVNTMDRFDDPKGKQITVTATD